MMLRPHNEAATTAAASLPVMPPALRERGPRRVRTCRPRTQRSEYRRRCGLLLLAQLTARGAMN